MSKPQQFPDVVQMLQGINVDPEIIARVESGIQDSQLVTRLSVLMHRLCAENDLRGFVWGLPAESLEDIKLLLAEFHTQDASTERSEIIKTISEVLFPDMMKLSFHP